MGKNDIRICDQCKHMSVKSMLARIAAIAPDAEVSVACKSYCGPCSRFVFIYVNGRYITGETEEETIAKAIKYIK